MTQISANISDETRGRLERFVRARGMKKGFVIEQALLHYLAVLDELPAEVIIPPRLVVDAKSGKRIVERIESDEGPNEAMKELFKDE